MPYSTASLLRDPLFLAGGVLERGVFLITLPSPYRVLRVGVLVPRRREGTRVLLSLATGHVEKEVKSSWVFWMIVFAVEA